MIREHIIIGGSEPMPPFVENLVFWAPMTENDVTDHISGTSPASDTDCSATWDSAKGMYLLVTTGSSSSLNAALIWSNLNLNINAASSQQYTITGVFEFVSMQGNDYSCYIACNNYRNQSHTTIRYTNGDVRDAGYSAPTTGIHRLTVIADNSSGLKRYYRYTDANCVTTLSNWSGFRTAPDSIAACQLLNNNIAMSIYAKDIRIYNRALSASEVAQL